MDSMVERDFSGFDIRVWQTDSIADVFEQVKVVFAENYRDANIAYLEKNAGKLRFMTTATNKADWQGCARRMPNSSTSAPSRLRM
ncbi:MAG: hypothetical protein U0837_17415 [Dehalococcoidia bacterium]